MRISEAYPTKYLSAADLQGKEPVVVIEKVSMEVFDGDNKPVVYFQGKDKGVVLNKTNANNIAGMYGDETNNWIGNPITLFTAWVDFNGRSVEAIRVKPAQANGATEQAPSTGMPEQRDTPASSLDDEIPF